MAKGNESGSAVPMNIGNLVRAEALKMFFKQMDVLILFKELRKCKF